MRWLMVSFITCVSVASECQNLPQPLTHVEACRKFSDAVVQINTERPSHGTGFIVDPDGWIVTAAHVVIDPKTKAKDGAITVILPKVGDVLAEEVLPIDDLLIARDFAVLKVNQSNLPHLELGDEGNVEIGSNLTIIGFPLSAMFRIPGRIPKFCLAGTLAANASFPVGKGNFIDTVYFQGVSIKGISGSPVISLDSGKVIGIVSTRLTGISEGLAGIKEQIAHGLGRGIAISGMEPGTVVDQIIDVLDLQLANGLGSATGAADTAFAVKKAQRHRKEGKNQP
jgi:serine protease Do